MLGVVISNRTFGSTKTYKANFTRRHRPAQRQRRPDGRCARRHREVDQVGVRRRARTSPRCPSRRHRDRPDDHDHRGQGSLPQPGRPAVPRPGRDARRQPPTDRPERRSSRSAGPAPAVDLTALFNGFKPLFQALTPADVNSFALEIIKTLQGEGGTVDSLLTQTASLTNTVAQRDAAIGQVIDNLLTVLNTVQKRDAGLGETITQLQRLVTGLAGDRDAIAASLTNINILATSSAKLFTGIRPVPAGRPATSRSWPAVLNTTKDPVDKTKNALARVAAA